jgi:lipopolysaccharide export LptBFGC system permease protein LptF
LAAFLFRHRGRQYEDGVNMVMAIVICLGFLLLDHFCREPHDALESALLRF